MDQEQAQQPARLRPVWTTHLPITLELERTQHSERQL